MRKMLKDQRLDAFLGFTGPRCDGMVGASLLEVQRSVHRQPLREHRPLSCKSISTHDARLNLPFDEGVAETFRTKKPHDN